MARRKAGNYVVLDARRPIEELYEEICKMIGGMAGV